MKIRITMTGTSPLVMHNVRLARPDDDFTRAIAKITAKRSKQTDDDRGEVARLEFAGSLYVDEEGPYVPTANIRRCLVEAAKVRRFGKAVERALIPLTMSAPLQYDGPRGVDELWKQPRFRYSTIVAINRAKTPRMRPQFPQWGLVTEWELLTETLNIEDLIAIVHSAGLIEGLGDNRRNGFGRFTSEVKQV